MSKKKNLERAVVLGLILSTGICGSAWAEGIDEFKNRASDGVITVPHSITVDGTGYYWSDVTDNSWGDRVILNNSLFDKDLKNLTVEIGNLNLTFNNVNMLSPHIIRGEGTSGANIVIKNDSAINSDKNGNNFAGISVSASIAGNSLSIESAGRGIYTGVDMNRFPVIIDNEPFYDVEIDVNEQFKITSASDAIFNEGSSESDVDITADSVYIENKDRNGIYNAGQSDDKKNLMTITATKGNILIESGGDGADQASVKNKTEGSTTLKADVGSIMLTSESNGIYATKGSTTLNSSAGNSIYAGDIVKNVAGTIKYGTKSAIHAFGGGKGENVTNVNLTTGKENYLLGAVYATGRAEKVTGPDADLNKYATKVILDGATNKVYSYTEIAGAGDINTTEDVIDGETNKFFGKRFISALYAEDGANIELTGENKIGTWANSKDANTLERTVWAYSSDDTIGSSISFDGAVQIGTDSYSVSPNSADVAIAAGTATDLTKNDVVGFNGKRSTVTVKYDNFSDGNRSSISGDILSAYAGKVDIYSENSNAGIKIDGNLFAGNNGILDVNLGKGGQLTGRVDDYGDAGVEGTTHGAGEDTANSFFNPAFSSEIIKGGTVNLTMGGGSRWNVTGQSWITSLTTTGNAEDTLISLEKAKEDLNSNASALTIGTLKGDTRFYMNLNGDRSASDMLYIKNAQGIDGGTAHYNIYLQDDVTSAEINSDGTKAFNGLRFATVGTGSNVDFTVKSQGTGSAFDVEYEVDTDSYVNNSENSDYNSTGGGEGNVEKPGNASVDDFFGLNDTSSQANAENNIMLMAETDEAIDTAANSAENSTLDEVTNFKIVKRLGEELNDTGKTILNMSRANYSNAIYMDRLNKRLGEARYINSEEDEGMWVRIRHDRIGKDDAYRSQNTMYELGYDQKQECDNGERRVGMAIDYMHGDTGYDQIAGKGEIDRYGLWLYDTWMGDKGHYADYVAKWGHLSNDFEVYTMQNGDKVTGDYSNNVFSVSAEYGRKKDIGNDWYFEPQVQAQLARVTGADYTTNQGTKVSVDGINSLIGRAGFRLGKDFGEEKQSTVYIKADVLHEFLGDQDVRVLDKSSDNKWAGISYENEGTWYDVGFGFATQMSKNSYAFMDFEKSFGNDNDETYQINVGMQWSF